ncbi:MAG: 50S ribosomal protein L23 [Candidatus Nealsonbacteria bacterium]|nr:50S ribosomal protein L23 [Candidatus Nealsonbacteria bacterium]
MALFDIFKKKVGKKEKTEKKEQKKEIKIAEKPKKTVVKKEKKEAPLPSKPQKTSPNAYSILKGPHITEKATELVSANQYIFNVYVKANKPEIKKTIEDIYGVKVVSVNIVNIPAKKRRLGKIEGWRKGYKKAIVKIKAGQKIEVLPR